MTDKARILFVDDEKRVLNSMRGLFRRDYELFLTTVGADAINIARENDVDVVVADQRMPGLTGTEVLGQIKKTSPRTVRILLTGYADPEAVEGSINIGEVFRFLSKPCPPKILKETLALAIEASRTQPVINEPVAKPIPPYAAAQIAQRPTEIPILKEHPLVENRRSTKFGESLRLSRRPADIQSPHLAATTRPAEARPAARRVVPPPEKIEFAVPSAVPYTKGSATPPLESTNALTPATGGHGRNAEPTLAGVSDKKRAADEDTDTKENQRWKPIANVNLSEGVAKETQTSTTSPTADAQRIKNVGVIVFTVDPEFAETTIRAFSKDRTTILATSLVKVAQAVEQRQAGVLVTDFTTNRAVLQKIIGVLKRYVPELVTIVVSDGRDTTDMINLINFGQVFRYILKPIDADSLKEDVNAAAVRYIQLRSNPESAKRHRVIDTPIPADASSTLTTFMGRIEKKAEAKQPESSDASATD